MKNSYSYLTVASGEAPAAGACVLPVIRRPVGGGQRQAEPPVEAGLAFAGVRARCGLGGGGLGRRGGVRGQLEQIVDGFRAVAQEQEEEEEKLGGREPPCNLCVAAGGSRRHT